MHTIVAASLYQPLEWHSKKIKSLKRESKQLENVSLFHKKSIQMNSKATPEMKRLSERVRYYSETLEADVKTRLSVPRESLQLDIDSAKNRKGSLPLSLSSIKLRKLSIAGSEIFGSLLVVPIKEIEVYHHK